MKENIVFFISFVFIVLICIQFPYNIVDAVSLKQMIANLNPTGLPTCNCSDSTHLDELGYWDSSIDVFNPSYWGKTVSPTGSTGHLIRKYFKIGRFTDYGISFDKSDPNTLAYHLKLLFLSFHKFTKENGITWFLGSGSLLGWYFQDGALDYDDDHDFVMLLDDAKKYITFNQTIVDYRYLIDINPYWCSRSKDFRQDNTIEMRYIDIKTGVYIDIVHLSPHKNEYTNNLPYKLPRYQQSYATECYTLNEIDKPGWPETRWTPHIDVLYINKNVTCLLEKSQHTYYYDDLFPLRNVLFEGQEVKIPHRPERILQQLYGERWNDLSFYSKRHKLWYDFDISKKKWIVRQKYIEAKKTLGFALERYNEKEFNKPIRPRYPEGFIRQEGLEEAERLMTSEQAEKMIIDMYKLNKNKNDNTDNDDNRGDDDDDSISNNTTSIDNEDGAIKTNKNDNDDDSTSGNSSNILDITIYID